MSTPPVTGHPGLDEACSGVADLSHVPLADQVARYTAAHEAIVDVLNAPVDSAASDGSVTPGTAPGPSAPTPGR